MILSSLLSLAHAHTQIMRAAVFLRRFTNRYSKSKKWQSSGHVEIDSMCPDDCHFLIGSPSAAGDQLQNGKHWGGGLLSC